MNTHNMVTIVQPPRENDEHGIRLANGTKFILADGSEITDVKRVVVSFEADQIVNAIMDLALDQIKDIEAHPMLGIETLRAAAEHYGYSLVKKTS